MRKIQFNEETISQIRDYINAGHTIKETQNRFTLKYETLKRVMRENNIAPYHVEKRNTTTIVELEKDVPDRVELVCKLFHFTNAPMARIVKESKLPYYTVISLLNDKFGEESVKRRSAKLYRSSKLGSKNSQYGKHGEESSQFKGGIVDDGSGYLMMLKPSWYTGRQRSNYVYYHHVVMCENLGISEIPKGFVVHHIDMNPLNNDISNLALMTVSAHAKLHSIEKNLCKVQRLSVDGVAKSKFSSLESLESSEAPDND